MAHPRHMRGGAEEIERIPTPDGRLMSVQLRITNSVLHLADEFPEMGVLAPPSVGGTAVVLALMSPTRRRCSRRQSPPGRRSASRCRTRSGAIGTGSSMTRSGTAGTSTSICVTSPTMRSWPPPPEPSPDLRHRLLDRTALPVSEICLPAMAHIARVGGLEPREWPRRVSVAGENAWASWEREPVAVWRALRCRRCDPRRRRRTSRGDGHGR